ncbi:hypothetical protein TNCV_1742821 [Trichonephila clavipes]|nr:hypothetical protein TNCV_1742821 [Trichonephila clavipes]
MKTFRRSEHPRQSRFRAHVPESNPVIRSLLLIDPKIIVEALSVSHGNISKETSIDFAIILVSVKTYEYYKYITYNICMPPCQYGGYDPRLVTEWVRVRIANCVIDPGLRGYRNPFGYIPITIFPFGSLQQPLLRETACLEMNAQGRRDIEIQGG